MTEPFAKKKIVQFVWEKTQQKDPTLAKRIVVKIFEPTKDKILITDYSEHSKSGILS